MANQRKEHNVEKFNELQRCHWQFWSIFIRLAFVASQICEIPRNSRKFIQVH